jgi:hypothetical protein
MLVTVRRAPAGEGPISVLGPLDTRNIGNGGAIERKVEEIDFFNIDRNLDSAEDDPHAASVQVTVELEDGSIHGIQYREGSTLASTLHVTDLVELIESTGGAPHLVTFDAGGHEVPFHPPFTCANWEAWYNRMPGRQDPRLHVTGECTLPVSGVKLTLEQGDVGVAPEPGLLALELKADFPDVSSEVMTPVTVAWAEDVGPDVERVRIQGAASAEIDVVEAQ